MTLHRMLEQEVDTPRPTPKQTLKAVPDPEKAPDAAPTPPHKARPHRAEQKRLASVDTFRGLTILGMLLVNNMVLGQYSPEQLVHARWPTFLANTLFGEHALHAHRKMAHLLPGSRLPIIGDGSLMRFMDCFSAVHFADMVMPWFLLIAGLSIPLAAASHRRRNLSRDVWIYKVFTRTFVLVLLGCVLDSAVKGQLTFDLGVLQLIGLSYCVASLLANLSQGGRLAVAAALFLAHWAFMQFYPVPGIGPGMYTESDNFVNWLNLNYLKPFHIEGLFSVVSCAGIVIVGTVFGDALRREDGISLTEIGYLFASGLVLTVLGWLWSAVEPFSKPMWTSSYLLFTGGLGLMVLAFFRVTVDLTRFSLWVYPLLVFGANAITVYVVPILVKMLILQRLTLEVGAKTYPLLKGYQEYLGACWGDPILAGWGYTLTYIGVCWLMLFVMYRKRIFVRV